MGNIYVDGLVHQDNSFFSKEERDKKVKELRGLGWKVKVGKYNDVDGSGEIYWYEAVKGGKHA